MSMENKKNNHISQEIINWLEDFKKKHGRPLKILHIGNIANNAYNNAKLMRKIGLDCDVLCYDYYHIMGCPEWEDADFEGDWGDDFSPDWTKVNLNGFKRPDWFVQGPLELCIKYLIAKRESNKPKQKKYWKLLSYTNHTKKSIYSTKSFFYLKKILFSDNILYLIRSKFNFLNKKVPLTGDFLTCLSFLILFPFIFPFILIIISWRKIQSTDNLISMTPDFSQELVDTFYKIFPTRPDKLSYQDIEYYKKIIPLWTQVFKYYDLIQAYATDTIYPMLAGVPYVAFEHGTLREIPFESTPTGRLFALSCHKAKKVIITNPDTILSAKKLNLNNYLFIPHPLDETKYTPQHTDLSVHLRMKYKVKYILFCPVRHDWEIKGTDIQIKGFARYIKNHKNALLVLTQWGNEIRKSKKLIKSFGIENYILWIKPVNEIKFIEYINASDIVLDQMILPSFGGVTYKAMSCAKPVIASFKYEANKWCMPEPPPIICAYNEKEVAEKIKGLLENEGFRKKIGQESRKWIIKYHSSKIILEKMVNIYKEILS